MNLKMADFRRCLETAGYNNVKTVLSSGNAAFDFSSKSASVIERQIEAAFTEPLGRSFYTIVRSVKELQDLIESDPYSRFDLPINAKRVVTFARALPRLKSRLPIERDGAQILAARDREAFSAYVPGPKGAVFMELIKANFGSDVTTRTWDTVKKCAKV
jgi:uncharacterized protein (DUF1697 family)